jgi:3-keto-5-aminohexanoate cleavage enzyme
MHKVWIEVALNGAWSRALQPGIPDTIEAIIAEGVACARAGATIVHTHAYDGGGPQTFDWQVYARIIEGIRAQVDVPVYPSYPPIPTTTAGANPSFADAAVRFAHIEALAARGLLEFAVIDPAASISR